MGYVPQLVLLPSEVSRTERGAVSALLHVATNSFDDGSIFNLASAGGPAICSLKVTSLAVLARTAYKTLPEWKHCCRVLETLTDDMPIELMLTRVASPSCWDSPPFAFNLKLIAECFTPTPAVDKFLNKSHFVNKARDRLATAAREGTRNLNKSRIRLDGKKVQKEFADRFKEALLPPSLEELLSSRFNKYFKPLCTPCFAPCWKDTVSCLKGAQPHFAMIALKTLLNTWCTQGRYHDCSADQCIFGCAGAVDDISHYASCERLWQASAEAAQMPLSASVEERLLLHCPVRQRLDVLVIAFTVYHAVKLGHPAAAAKAQRTSDFDEIQSLTASVAKAQAIKLGIGQVQVQLQTHTKIETEGALPNGELCARSAKEADPRGSSCDVAAPSPDRTFGETGVLGPDELDERPFCEPECNEFPVGKHHACCSQAYFEAENNPDMSTSSASAADAA
jgi:hypothetical protein